MVDSESFLVVIEPEPRSGSWNMAVDEALLESAGTQQRTSLRFYRWNEPTLSLGYFQKRLPEDSPEPHKPLAQVRRLSGGGAILHHHEWTYACALPPGHPLIGVPTNLYDVVHTEIIRFLQELGVPTQLRGASSTQPGAPFLCFGREDPRDIILGPHKIVGSAQRRRRGAILQHGSLLLRCSEFAPAYPGLLDLLPDSSPVLALIPELALCLSRALQMPPETPLRTAFPEEISVSAQQLEQTKYHTLDWRSSPDPSQQGE